MNENRCAVQHCAVQHGPNARQVAASIGKSLNNTIGIWRDTIGIQLNNTIGL
jgi:hypothetical protein